MGYSTYVVHLGGRIAVHASRSCCPRHVTWSLGAECMALELGYKLNAYGLRICATSVASACCLDTSRFRRTGASDTESSNSPAWRCPEPKLCTIRAMTGSLIKRRSFSSAWLPRRPTRQTTAPCSPPLALLSTSMSSAIATALAKDAPLSNTTWSRAPGARLRPYMTSTSCPADSAPWLSPLRTTDVGHIRLPPAAPGRALTPSVFHAWIRAARFVGLLAVWNIAPVFRAAAVPVASSSGQVMFPPSLARSQPLLRRQHMLSPPLPPPPPFHPPSHPLQPWFRACNTSSVMGAALHMAPMFTTLAAYRHHHHHVTRRLQWRPTGWWASLTGTSPWLPQRWIQPRQCGTTAGENHHIELSHPPPWVWHRMSSMTRFEGGSARTFTAPLSDLTEAWGSSATLRKRAGAGLSSPLVLPAQISSCTTCRDRCQTQT